MRVEQVEIYSDATNAAIMRHPGRRFPGVLIQGDSLHNLCRQADEACLAMGRSSPGYEEANDLRNALQSYLAQYKTTLSEHNIAPPFADVR